MQDTNLLNRVSKKHIARVGLYTTGLRAYWEQFEGLEDRLKRYSKFVEAQLASFSSEVYNFGMVDDVNLGRRAGEWFNEKNVDIIFCYCATYFTSNTILPIHQICKSPVVVLNLQPTARMNYENSTTGEWLAHCNACPIPEISNAFNRAKISVKIINGLLGLDKTPEISMTDEVTHQRTEAKEAWKEIEEWTRVAGVVRTLQHSNFGFLGNTYSGMLDMYSDMTMIQAQTGINVSVLEMCDLHSLFTNVTDKEISNKLAQINTFFNVLGATSSDPRVHRPTQEQLFWSAKVAVAQEKLVHEYDLDALSYYYHAKDGNLYEEIQSGFIVGHSLLTAQDVPCAGEGDLKTAVAMKICDTLEIGGSFSEIVAIDYDKNTIIVGHDGPFHIKISNNKPLLRGMGVYHGKRGSGISVEANVVCGDITTLGLSQTHEDGLKMIVSEGASVDAPILTIGNTQTHIDFNRDPKSFMNKWFLESPTHHCALSVGHEKNVLEKVACLLDIKFTYV